VDRFTPTKSKNDPRSILHISSNAFYQRKCFVFVIFVCNYPGVPHLFVLQITSCGTVKTDDLLLKRIGTQQCFQVMCCERLKTISNCYKKTYQFIRALSVLYCVEIRRHVRRDKSVDSTVNAAWVACEVHLKSGLCNQQRQRTPRPPSAAPAALTL